MSETFLITLVVLSIFFTINGIVTWITAWSLSRHAKRLAATEYNYSQLWQHQQGLEAQHTRAYWEYKENLNQDLRDELSEWKNK